MDVDRFIKWFERTLATPQWSRPRTWASLLRSSQKIDDPCPDVVGMASSKKLKLLNLAVSILPNGGQEAYLEVGTYLGKSLVAATLGNSGRLVVGCDNFSEFATGSANNNYTVLQSNLAKYGLLDKIKFYDEDFQSLFQRWRTEGLPPIGVYFYDGAHDEESQYRAIRYVEPLLADSALVIVDDWRWANDSRSYAETATRKAISESQYQWEICYILPARFNGDTEMWWNGVALLTFRRS